MLNILFFSSFLLLPEIIKVNNILLLYKNPWAVTMPVSQILSDTSIWFCSGIMFFINVFHNTIVLYSLLLKVGQAHLEIGQILEFTWSISNCNNNNPLSNFINSINNCIILNKNMPVSLFRISSNFS